MEDDEIEHTINGIRWNWLTPAILGIGCIGEVVGIVGETINDLSVAIARHSIWKMEQREFEQEATMAIERIANG